MVIWILGQDIAVNVTDSSLSIDIGNFTFYHLLNIDLIQVS